MKCAKCGAENKRLAKFCSDCGTALLPAAAPASPAKPLSPQIQEPSGPFWKPDLRWHVRALIGIYAALAVIYFALSLFLSKVPEPYRMRDVPAEMTPWLKR